MSTYTIKRFFADKNLSYDVIEQDLSLEEAQAWCKDPESSWRTATSDEAQKRTNTYGPWFDGYTEE